MNKRISQTVDKGIEKTNLDSCIGQPEVSDRFYSFLIKLVFQLPGFFP